MKNIKLVSGDLYLEGKDFSMVEDEEELVQTVRELFSINQGEWTFDTSKGLDYFRIIGKTFDEEVARSAILDAAAQEERIQDITNIQFEQEGRKLVIRMKVNGEEVEINAVE